MILVNISPGSYVLPNSLGSQVRDKRSWKKRTGPPSSQRLDITDQGRVILLV